MNKLFIFASIAFLATSTITGCRKKKDTIAKVTVKDAANAVVEGATVVLYSTGTDGINTIHDTTETNSSGVAVFNFNDVYQLGQAGVAVLDIHAYTSTASGVGVIKVEEETTTEETVYVN